MAAPAHPAGGLPPSLLLVGCGKMGGALLDGWLAVGLEGRRITVVDPYAPPELMARFVARGVALNPGDGAAKPPGVLVLATKPQGLAATAPTLSAWTGADTLLVSIVAGKTIADLGRAFPRIRAIARVMPNTPAAVGRGISGVAVNDAVGAAQRGMIDALLGAVGQVEWLADEALIDAVTAVSGSGPAYVFYLVECLAKAGVAMGLAPDQALRLARATVEGAGALMVASVDTPPEQLRLNVTSPGGTTAAAVAVLAAEGRLEAIMAEAVAAARDRARALAG